MKSRMALMIILLWFAGLDQKTVFTGRVTSLYGRPLNEVRITLQDKDQKKLAMTRTDKQGHYSFEVEKSLPYDLIISAEGLGFYVETVDLGRVQGDLQVSNFGLRLLRFTDNPTYNPKIIVQTKDGTPIPQASIKAICPFNEKVAFQSETDAQGRARMDINTGGQYLFSVTHPNFKSGCQYEELPGIGMLNVDKVLIFKLEAL